MNKNRMNCGRLEKLLERFLEGSLEAAVAQECREHVADCVECTELVELAALGVESISVPKGLLWDVLARTSGLSCELIESHLLQLEDGDSESPAQSRIGSHLETCSVCRELRETLAGLAAELPSLASISPGRSLVPGVLAATLPARARLRSWWRRTGTRWVLRPRFASEVAFAATLVLLILFWIPGSPVAAMPQKAVAFAKTDPVEVIGVIGESVRFLEIRRATDSIMNRATRRASDVGSRAQETFDTGKGRLGTLWQAVASSLATGNQGEESDSIECDPAMKPTEETS